MDMLFSRKRSMSIAARHKEQSSKAKPPAEQSKTTGTLKKVVTVSDKKAGKRKEALDQAFGSGNGGRAGPSSAPLAGTRRVDDKAPSLTLDIRNSLMMPGLSQRFSVLLPKLSTAPETSIRSLLASQRAREDGPSLTLEEEELLFAEIRDNSAPYSPPSEPWDGSAPSTAWKSHSTDYLNRSNISTSTSSPSILSQSSEGTITRDRQALNGSTSSQAASPPPTSSSFSSFKTFGVQQQQEQGIKTKSYGFSGRSQMRDETYLRKVGKQQGLESSRKSSRGTHSTETSPSDATVPLPSMPSQMEDASPHARSASNTSNGTATPTSASILDSAKPRIENGGHSNSSSTSLVPTSALADTQHLNDTSKSQDRKAKRQSHLASLTPAQQKRISKALIEIDMRLRREQMADPFDESPVMEDEEVLEPEEEDEDLDEKQDSERLRRPSYTDSDGSFQSQHSAPFPYGISPAKPEQNYSIPVEPPSPSRLPPSPRSHNLKAQVEGTADPIPPLSLTRKLSVRSHLPEPILTPIKTLPTKHVPSPSTSSPSAVSPVPGYVPGQPRPVGSMHRSDGSISSRSATPTGHTPISQNPEISAVDPLSYLRGHLRAGSTPTHPPPVTSRTSSLSRSRSVSQTPENRLDEDSPLRQLAAQSQDNQMLGEQRPNWSRRPSSNISATSPAMIKEESEDELEESEQEIPDLREVEHRREMSRAAQNPQQHMEQARDALGWSINSATGDESRAVSEEGHIPAADETTFHDLHRTVSQESVGSDFEDPHDIQDIWGHLLGTGPSSSENELDMVETPSSAVLSNQLKQLSGLGQENLAVLQDRLVDKAKAERQAYRDDSPVISSSPALGTTNLPQRSASLARGQMPIPPSSWRRPSHEREVPSTAPLPTASKSLANMFTPPSAAEKAAQAQGIQYASAPNTAKRSQMALAEPPLTSAQTPSAEGHDEMIHTPVSDQLSRNPSTRNPANIREGKVALDEDPEVRRDFEARIAAATAALNRTPTVGGKLERKPTKKGVFSISSPKLVSSSSNVHTNPLTSPEAPLDASTKKALEKTSGSGKGSGRWRKLGFRSRPSVSGQNAPETAAPVPMPRPVTPTKATTTSPALGPTPKTEKNLAAAIKLPSDSPISPDLDNFKFPPVANKQPRNPAIRDRPISPPMPYQPTMQQVAEQMPRAPASEPKPVDGNVIDIGEESKSGDHSHSSSDSTVAKFIESGRALGLNQEQLDQMLVANGMLDRSGTIASTRSYQSTAPNSNSLSNSTHSVSQSQLQSLVRKPSESNPSETKPKGGLFRAFSKKKGKAAEVPPPVAPVPSIQEPVAEPRNVVVRRTLLLPHPPTLPVGPTTPTKNKAGSAFESPDSIKRFAGGRKQSIKRKPLNLTREDHELVSNSPPASAHRRNFSTGTIQSNRSGDTPDNQPGNKGLGFLHPLAGSTRSQGQGHSSSFSGLNSSPGGRSQISEGSKRRSSTGGSLYDLYGGHDADEQEMLAPNPEQAVGAEGQSQAVEICEYADGQVVWSLVNGMRSEEDDEDDYQFSSHSRQDSVTSDVSSGQYDSAPAWPHRAGSYATPALNLRHRERDPPVQRPETFVYRAATGDVADLIDHLSRDLDASRGRIDIRHLGLPRETQNANGNSTGQSSPFPYSADQSRSGDDDNTENSPDPRFADPPSPNPPRSLQRPTPPPPIFAPSRTAQVPAGGFSPKRQMMVRQGFAAHRANVSAGGGNDTAQALGYGQASPIALSFQSSDSGGQRTVEERLQNLLDRIKEENDQHEAGFRNRI